MVLDNTAQFGKILESCRRAANPYNAFHDVILQRPPLWSAQRAILRALHDPAVSTIVCPAGHSVGKTYCAATALLGWLTLNRDSMVVSTSPSNYQLNSVLWKNIRAARNQSPILRHVGRLLQNPNRLDYGNGWHALGYSVTKPENLQGHHSSGPLLNVVDEGSGITDPEIWATLRSLKPRKTLVISQPLRADGPFYEMCQRAEDDPSIRLIRIPSTDSPDIHLEHSERGLADASWLREMGQEFGPDSLVYLVRVLAQFPRSSQDTLIPMEWLEACGRARHQRAGHTRLAIDLAGGGGGDRTVLIVRDDNGVLHMEHSNEWPLEVAATRAALLAQKYGVAPHRISWDMEGLGWDFANRLQQVGLRGCRPYRSTTTSKYPRYHNLKAACHCVWRERLNPQYRDQWNRPLPVFSIPQQFLTWFRPEVRALKYYLNNKGGIQIVSKDEVKAVLHHSPDFTDTMAQSFAFND